MRGRCVLCLYQNYKQEERKQYMYNDDDDVDTEDDDDYDHRVVDGDTTWYTKEI